MSELDKKALRAAVETWPKPWEEYRLGLAIERAIRAYLAASPAPTRDDVLIDIVKRLIAIADASLRQDGTDIPLGSECREAATTIERLTKENAELIHDNRCYVEHASELATENDALRSELAKARKALTIAQGRLRWSV